MNADTRYILTAVLLGALMGLVPTLTFGAGYVPATFFGFGVPTTVLALAFKPWILGLTGWKPWIILPAVALVLGAFFCGIVWSALDTGLDPIENLKAGAAFAFAGPIFLGPVFLPIVMCAIAVLRWAGDAAAVAAALQSESTQRPAQQ